MNPHLACIGIWVDSAESFGKVVDPLLGAGETEDGPGASSAVIWTDPSGAGLVASMSRGGEPECVKPAFFGDGRLRALVTRIGLDPSIPHCDPLVVAVADPDGQTMHPLAVHIDDMALTRPRLPVGQEAILAVTFFGEAIEVFEDAAAFERWQGGHGVHHPVPSLLATALLAGDDAPEALVTARITEADLRHNTATGHPFYWLAVEVPGGTADMVIPLAALASPPAPGAIVHGTCWVSGRVQSGLLPGPSRRSGRGRGLRRPGGRRP